MTTTRIDHIPARTPEEIESAFRYVELRPVACNNWAQEYPYAPKVGFRMFHTGEKLYLRFEVEERYTQALVAEDNGEVWTDSCVEFFLSLDDTGYYNFETSCNGRLLLAFRKRKTEPTYASPEVMRSVERWPSLGGECFAEREGDNPWTMTLAVPASALFRHRLGSWCGVEARMNLYKCGDKLTKPHFLSWKPIDAPAPDFHLPQYFRTVQFSK